MDCILGVLDSVELFLSVLGYSRIQRATNRSVKYRGSSFSVWSLVSHSVDARGS